MTMRSGIYRRDRERRVMVWSVHLLASPWLCSARLWTGDRQLAMWRPISALDKAD